MKEIINGLEVEVDAYIPTVTLVSREIDCSTIDKDTFVKCIIEDVSKAAEIYFNMRKPFVDAQNEEYVANITKRIMDYANSNYKREYYKNRYINEHISKINHHFYSYDDLGYVDFKPDKAQMSISYDCILSLDKIEEIAPRCFEMVKDDEYFKNAKGWSIKYHTLFSKINGVEDRSLRSSFRPFVDMILPEDLSQKLKERESNLVNSVANFYEGCTYFGD